MREHALGIAEFSCLGETVPEPTSGRLVRVYRKIILSKRGGFYNENWYLFTYRYGSTRPGGMMALQMAQSVAAGQDDAIRAIQEDHDLSSLSWVFINRYGGLTERIVPGSFPRSYGIELYNERGMAIGYLGMAYPEDISSVQGHEIALFRRSTDALKTGLLASLDELVQ